MLGISLKGWTAVIKCCCWCLSGKITYILQYMLQFLCRSAGSLLCLIVTQGPRLREHPLSGALLIALGEGKKKWQVAC